MSKLFVWVNDSLIPSDEANLNIADLAVQRGYGIFDFFKTIGGKPVFLEDHLDRLFRSAVLMRLELKQSRDEIRDKIIRLIESNNLKDSGIKGILTGGFSSDGFNIAEPNLIISQQAFQIPRTISEKGISILTHEYQRQFSNAKTLDYLQAIWLQPILKEKKADDVLYYSNGLLRECPRANIFIVTKDHKVLTPESGMLKGVTRKHVLEISEARYVTEARDVSLEELRNAGEVFITSTTKNILPVVQVDGYVIGDGNPGEVSRALAKEYNRIIYGS
ncbi:aminotransferase class IV [Daejeonella sp.]|uniref:aminotransferase class IV n=1 Tax=Daejeonella sp. TaxID=2805397 RepID=UPI00271ACBB1|nr:aminotransferase class IV [Daejeonella sp.]MDO8993719.1 aminotransferase class IV [Daejeonella sp.]MDP2413403.1 aminotransferase class IV [Daejeonella sp.]